MFVDMVEIYVKSGDGGNGCVSFRREKYVPNGGPEGGDGGNGGNIIFFASHNVDSLSKFKYRKKFIAQNGENGKKSNMHGKNGQDLEIEVPFGTLIKNKITGNIIADIQNEEEIMVLKGGKGGWGNSHFANSVRQAPRFSKNGILGIEAELLLELKLIADVGLIGFPNVGKSTFLSIVSNAKPKISNYHFTTLIPNLGLVNVFNNCFLIADIPGIIKGAHTGAGLGYEFLRHIERTKILIHVVDVSGIEGRDPIKDLDTINEEILKYSKDASEKFQVIAANKMDLPQSERNYKNFEREAHKRGYKVFATSTATNKGIKELLNFVCEKISKVPKQVFKITENLTDFINTEKNNEKICVSQVSEGTYNVEGSIVKNIVNSTNFDDFDSCIFFYKSIKKFGIENILKKNGIKNGDAIKMCGIEFEYME
ncbi:MAG: GTPase ObgE [Clostridiales bacterium]|nr:GTPase ObgE [Clostridiales bacterium]